MAMTLTRVRHALSYLSLAAMLGLLGFYVFFEPPFLSYHGLPFIVLNTPREVGQLPKVHRGTPARLKVTRCSADTEPRTYGIAHLLVCQQTLVLPATQVTVMPGCTTVESLINVVPETWPQGVCHIEGLAEINGKVRNITVPWRSEDFEVVP